ncbi:MAG: hypothetical protein ACRD1D_11255 [Acidimicrobiales bacterium]
MKRRTLDILFSIGGLGIAALLAIMGLVMTSNANFSQKYVTDQLAQQKITFKPAAALSEEERQYACLVEHAGQPLLTGKQAECYANHFIGLHVKNTAGGKTYAELGDVQTALRAQIAEAQKVSDPELPALQKQLADTIAQRETVFKGETLRGVLLTSYGFSTLGEKADQAATVAYLGAGLMLLLSLAGAIHAARTPKTKAFAAPQPPEVEVEVDERKLTTV